MPSIKHRRRAKRRAEKLVEESLDALASGHDALADKLIQRALSAGPANARFWLEYALISQQRGFTRRADRAVRPAPALPPRRAGVPRSRRGRGSYWTGWGGGATPHPRRSRSWLATNRCCSRLEQS